MRWAKRRPARYRVSVATLQGRCRQGRAARGAWRRRTLKVVDHRVALAAGNNADWCDLVCRAHGVRTERDQDVWVALRRSPPLYPDAVTLRQTTPAFLERIDTSPGCSVKDSFASADLSGYGFRVLFEAEWIHRPPTPGHVRRGLDWSPVRTPGELRLWDAPLSPALLDNPAVVILTARDGDDVVAGVVGNRSAEVAGLSNMTIRTADPDQVWAEAGDVLGGYFPGLPLVGYESGESLDLAHRAGFSSVGPLRVWLIPDGK